MDSISKSIPVRQPDRRTIFVWLGFSLAASAILAVVVTLLSPGAFGAGWLSAFILLFAASLLLILVWNWGGRDRALAWMMLFAFLLRLATGIGLSLALPVWGYDEPGQRAGYVFKDAYSRDTQSWELASSGKPVWASFKEEFATDQYGGLLALSALVYRTFSPDAHRPFLILILGAFFAALGVPFLRAAIRLRWSERIAGLACWIYVLYPDSIFFASSQMREPFLMGLSAVTFWAVLSWNWREWTKWVALLGSLLGMALISNRVAAAVTGFLGLLFLLEYVISRPNRRWQVWGWIGLSVGIVMIVLFSGEWFRSSTRWDIKVTQTDSGWVTKVIDEASQMAHIPREYIGPVITVAYGLARPVLPAAVAETAESMLAKSIVIVRSVGWYALAPFLVYALFAVWRETDPEKRRRSLWLVLTVFAWLVIASARGGGDVTDNPRYRSLFMPWLALLAAWSIDWALVHRDAWLWRWIAVEVVFLGFFTNWYFSRYFHAWQRLSFWAMISWIVGLTGVILVGGWVWDRMKVKKQAAPLLREK
jgi:hypothetical protein